VITSIASARGPGKPGEADEQRRFRERPDVIADGVPGDPWGETACIARDDDGALVAISSVVASGVPPVGGLTFWVLRTAVLPAAEPLLPALTAASFAALEEEFDPARGGPIGMCLLLDGAGRAAHPPEADWVEPPFLYAGYLADGRQLRIAYFARARVGPGVAPAWPGEPLPPGYGIHLFAEQDLVGAEAVIAMWTRAGVLAPAVAAARVPELLHVVTDPSGAPAGVSTAYLSRHPRLLMDLWHYRTFVAAEHRWGRVGRTLFVAGAAHLRERFESGRDRRGAGVVFDLEHEGLKHFSVAVWPTGHAFIGLNDRGDHVRVGYFPGALAPPPPGPAQGST
jgi:hypothetical protein